jgi:hypothetical protein
MVVDHRGSSGQKAQLKSVPFEPQHLRPEVFGSDVQSSLHSMSSERNSLISAHNAFVIYRVESSSSLHVC